MEHQQVSALFFDLSAAFDTVDHSILIEVLNNKFGVTSTTLQWFKDYVTNRKFKVCINNTYFDEKDLSFSVPQGSINGPVLFNSNSSPIRDVIDTEITVNAFTDDHSLQKCFKPINDNESQAIELLEINLKKAGEWMCQNRLKLNPGKMEYITFGTRQQLNKCRVDTITVYGQEVMKSRIVKYLGTWFDEKLTFQLHVPKMQISSLELKMYTDDQASN